MKIGIIGAMLEEVDGIYQHNEISWHNTQTIGQREYHLGNYQRHEIILVFSRCGKVASASATTTLIDVFNVDTIIFTGVAGAAAADLNIGDIVIASKTIQHDMNAEPLFPRFEIPLTEKSYFKTHPRLLALAKDAAKFAINDKVFKQLPLTTFNIETPMIKIGTLASGDQFVTDMNITKALISSIEDLQCVDMESAATAQVCDDYNIPYIAIRIVSDKADHSASIDFTNFIDQLASPLNQLIIKYLLAELTRNSKVL